MPQIKHGWNSLAKYLSIHEKILNRYLKTYYVRGPEKYTIKKITDQNLEMSIRGLILRSEQGREIEFKIEKTIEVDISYARQQARTFDYSYHALRPQPNAQNLIRYCSPHDHRPYHHKHVYKDDGGFEVLEVPEGTWPHVNEFFDEVLGSF